MRHRDLSRAMRSQELWYSGAYLFTCFPLGLQFVFEIEAIVSVSLVSFQLIGFTNDVIYVRPKFLKFRRDHRNIGVVSSIWYTLTRKSPPAASTTSRDVNNRRIQEESSSPPSQFLLLDRLSSGMASLRAGMKRWMTSDSDAALASAEKDDPINTSSRQEVDNHADDEKCSVICEREEGEEEQQDEEFLLCEDHHSIEKGGRNDVDLETNDGIGIRNQGMVENDASGRGVG